MDSEQGQAESGITELGFSGTRPRKQPKTGFKASFKQGFSSFFAIFDDFFKVSQCLLEFSTLQSKHAAKNEEFTYSN